jgi:hypothetical protein
MPAPWTLSLQTGSTRAGAPLGGAGRQWEQQQGLSSICILPGAVLYRSADTRKVCTALSWSIQSSVPHVGRGLEQA